MQPATKLAATVRYIYIYIYNSIAFYKHIYCTVQGGPGLNGPPGPSGSPGANGKDGDKGDQGERGSQGNAVSWPQPSQIYWQIF